jgi:hypothetical protein
MSGINMTKCHDEFNFEIFPNKENLLYDEALE